jgi:site-specific recombinase XerD
MTKKSVKQADWEKLVENEAKLRGYSSKTIGSYTYCIGKYLASEKTPKYFLLDLIHQGKSNETIRLTGFAIKFYLKASNKGNPKLNDFINNLPNLKRAKKLPVILSKQEIQQMIISTKNYNHRLIIQIAYAAGLRVSEIINLKWQDIDFSRNTIHIKAAKGKKDRIVMLSFKIKKALQRLDTHKQGLVFKTTRGGKYSPRTIQVIICNTVKKARINKKVTPHTLRHSFATHLLEKGVDIRYIKELLGHSNISTTLIYTKVSNKDLSKIKSPLD